VTELVLIYPDRRMLLLLSLEIHVLKSVHGGLPITMEGWS
jgi:hypothetical protein